MPTTYSLSPFYVDGENNYKLFLASDICRRLKKYSNNYSLLEMVIGAYFVVATAGVCLKVRNVKERL